MNTARRRSAAVTPPTSGLRLVTDGDAVPVDRPAAKARRGARASRPALPALSIAPPAEAVATEAEVTEPASELDDLRRQVASLREQLTETQRLATIGTISAVIAHEFNNLLTPIVSYSQFALGSAEGETPDLPLIRKALTKAYQSSTKAGKICASMLSLARGESSFGPVSIQKLVDEALSVLARDPTKDGIALRVQVQAGLTVIGDEVQLEQVLLNLLINARHALLAHGRNGAITVIAADAEDGAGVCIRVIDNGPGIPERVIGKIFEPFFTTKATARRGEQKGTGLGLHICRQIVDHHKGRLTVESAVGRGTTFGVHLPAMPAA